MDLLQQLIEFKDELNELIKGGMDLQTVSKYTYAEREKRRNVPYLAIGSKDPETKVYLNIWAAPTVKQKELYEFFAQHTTDSVFNDYTMYADLEESGGMVVIKRRLGKGKDNHVLI